jgi:HK97 gp10 family phage protein
VSLFVKVRLDGVKRLQKKLAELPRSARGKISRRAVNAGSLIVLQSARRKVPTRSKVTKKSLGRKGKTGKKGYFSVVGPRHGFKVVNNTGQTYDPAKMAHLIEGGTRPHKIVIRSRFGKPLATPQTINHPGSRAQPFVRPALQDNRSAVINAITQKMREGLAMEAAKS